MLASGLLLAATLAGAAPAHAAPGFDLRGTWRATALGSYNSTITITTVDCSTGAYTGSGTGGGSSWPESGTLTGNRMVGTAGPYVNLPAYTATYDITFTSPDAAAGTFDDTYGRKGGSYTYTRLSGPPAGGGCTPIPPTDDPNAQPTPTPLATSDPASLNGRHPTALQVMCTYVVLTSQDTCTATVGDAAPQPTTPTGTVRFGKTEGGFLGDGTCVLASSPSAPSTASCSVQYQRPYGSTRFPEISGEYSGDATHAPSRGATSFLILGGPPSFTSKVPNQVEFQVPVDADGTRVTSCATTASRSTSARRAIRLQTPSPDPAVDLTRLTQQLQQADDRQTQALLPGMQQALDRAREQMAKNRAEYDRRIAAGEKPQKLQGLLTKQKELADAVGKLSSQLGDTCRVIIGNLKALPEAFAAATRTAGAPKRRRTATVLGSTVVRSAKAGSLPISLKLNGKALRRVATRKRPATVYIRTITITPSGLFARGLPQFTIRPVQLSRDGLIVG